MKVAGARSDSAGELMVLLFVLDGRTCVSLSLVRLMNGPNLLSYLMATSPRAPLSPAPPHRVSPDACIVYAVNIGCWPRIRRRVVKTTLDPYWCTLPFVSFSLPSFVSVLLLLLLCFCLYVFSRSFIVVIFLSHRASVNFLFVVLCKMSCILQHYLAVLSNHEYVF